MRNNDASTERFAIRAALLAHTAPVRIGGRHVGVASVAARREAGVVEVIAHPDLFHAGGARWARLKGALCSRQQPTIAEQID